MSGYTQGEWLVTGPNGYRHQLGIGIYKSAGIDPIAAVYGAGDEVKANARLVAASPDLLEALRDLAACHAEGGYVQPDDDVLTAARAAIAKATGKGA